MPRKFIRIFMVGPESWKSLGILNPNAFSTSLKSSAMACADKLALVSYSTTIIQKAIDRDLEAFTKQINHSTDFKGFTPNPQKPVIAIYRNMSLQVGVQSFFITIKSTLDIYSRIVSKAIVPKSNLFGFGKAPFRGKKIAGGTLLNFLERNTAKSCVENKKLIGIFLSHIDDWIGDVIKIRDDIVHTGQPSDLIEMCVPILKKPQEITKDEIILPAIRGKGNILEYCQHVRRNIDSLLEETLTLLPGIDTKLLAF